MQDIARHGPTGDPALQADPASDPEAAASRQAWQRLTGNGTLEDTATAWAELMLEDLAGVAGAGAVAAVALRRDPDTGQVRRAGSAPRGRMPAPAVMQAAEAAMDRGAGVVRGDIPGGSGGRGCVQAAVPLSIDGTALGAVVAEMRPDTRAAMQAGMRRLQWGAAWLSDRLRAELAAAERDRFHAAAHALHAVAAVAEQDSFARAARAACTDLATRFDCDRVSLGFRRLRRTKVTAISHQAQFSRRMALTRALAAAMDEAVDQRAPVLWPEGDTPRPMSTRAAAALARDHGAEAAQTFTVPLYAGGVFVGALTFERPGSHPFDDRDLEILEAVTTVLAPVLDEKRRGDRWLIVKAWDSLIRHAGLLVGPAHVGRKLIAAGLVAGAAFLWFVTGTDEVTADARVEGQISRVIGPASDGVIAEAPVRPGDRVAEGDLLVRLDDSDLQLERLRLETELQSERLEYDRAVAARDRAESAIRDNAIAQAEARLRLIDAEIARTRLVAPFDGIVVSGDLDQSLGAAVARGEDLLTLAPQGGFEVVMQVDERRVDEVAPGQQGALRVAALPGRSFPVTVLRVTPVASHAEGETTFAVEARLDSEAPVLAPGMEGAARIAVGERRLIDIWVQPLVDRARLALWRFGIGGAMAAAGVDPADAQQDGGPASDRPEAEPAAPSGAGAGEPPGG